MITVRYGRAPEPGRRVPHNPSTRPSGGRDSTRSLSSLLASIRRIRASIASTRTGHSAAGTIASTCRTRSSGAILPVRLKTRPSRVS